jgi:hypothetical protein
MFINQGYYGQTVGTCDDLLLKYPNPEHRYIVHVAEDDITYIYDKIAGKWLPFRIIKLEGEEEIDI